MRDAALYQLANQVADKLGDSWKVEPPDDDIIGHYLTAGPDSARLFLRRDQHDHGRLSIRGVFPRTDYYYGEHDQPGRQAITVGLARGEAAIVREISRRVLPFYLPLLGRVLERNRTDQAGGEQRRATAGLLLGLVPGARPQPSHVGYDGIMWHGTNQGIGYGDLRLSNDGKSIAELEIRSLPTDVAMRLLKVLAEHYSTSV